MRDLNLQEQVSQSVIIRGATAEDLKFIELTFLKGSYHGNPCLSDYGSIMYIPKPAFMEGYKSVLENLIKISIIPVACLKEQEDVMLGYAIFTRHPEGSILHYVHVKEAWRKLGIARKLVPGDTISTTATSLPGNSIRRKKKISYNPFKT